MANAGGHLEAIAGTLAREALPARIASLEAENTGLREAIGAAHAGLAEWSARGAAWQKAIDDLTAALVASEADRAARLEHIHVLERLIEAERAQQADRSRSPLRRLAARAAAALRPAASAPRPAGAASGGGEEAPETVVFRAMSTERALWRVARRGISIGTVIDVGASNGMWSAVCERQFPDARYLLVEAQEVHRAALEAYCRSRPNADFVLAAAGARGGEIWFDDSDPFGGLASERPSASMKRRVPVTTLDHEVATRGLPGPFLVKLDVHGFEVPILEGAAATLRDAALVVIECYTFRVAEGSLLFAELVAWMRERGFGVLDASEPLWRARDGCLWQLDLFFQPLSRTEFAANSWS